MTNKEAISNIKVIKENIFEVFPMTEEDKEQALDLAIKALDSQWIPVSERLPEKNMACLVSVGNFHLTQIAMYSDLMQTINHKIFYQGDYGHENFMNITEYVKAWQPLPEPYKESEDNE